MTSPTPSEERDGLVEQSLRDAASVSLAEEIAWGSAAASRPVSVPRGLLNLAAAEITRLRAELADTRAELNVCKSTADLLRDQGDRLREANAQKDEALKPFAEACTRFAFANDDYRVIADVTIGDLRRARAARMPAEGRAALEQEGG